jgi:hypothetical protein
MRAEKPAFSIRDTLTVRNSTTMPSGIPLPTTVRFPFAYVSPPKNAYVFILCSEGTICRVSQAWVGLGWLSALILLFLLASLLVLTIKHAAQGRAGVWTSPVIKYDWFGTSGDSGKGRYIYQPPMVTAGYWGSAPAPGATTAQNHTSPYFPSNPNANPNPGPAATHQPYIV